MTVVLVLAGAADEVPCTVPSPDADHVLPEGRCPACSAAPWRVSGGPQREVDDRVLVARAACRSCGAWVGELHVRFATLFGFEEDRRVLHGRARVY